MARVLKAAGFGLVQPSAPLPHQLTTTMDLCQAAAGQRANSSFCSGCQHYNEMSSEREMTFMTSCYPDVPDGDRESKAPEKQPATPTAPLLCWDGALQSKAWGTPRDAL